MKERQGGGRIGHAIASERKASAGSGKSQLENPLQEEDIEQEEGTHARNVDLPQSGSPRSKIVTVVASPIQLQGSNLVVTAGAREQVNSWLLAPSTPQGTVSVRTQASRTHQ